MEIQERRLEDMSFDELKEYARVLEMVVLGEKEKTTKSEQGVMKTKEEMDQEEIKEMEEENADSEKLDKVDNSNSNNDSSTNRDC